MNKAELVNELASTLEMSKAQAKDIVSALGGIVIEALASGSTVRTPFGTLRPVQRAARVARNPKTGAKVKVAARKGVKFKASKALATELN